MKKETNCLVDNPVCSPGHTSAKGPGEEWERAQSGLPSQSKGAPDVLLVGRL